MASPAGDELERNHSEIWELIRTLVLGQASPAHILELYYWTQDTALLEFVRAVVLLPAADRARLLTFFSSAPPQAMSVSQSGVNRMVVEIPQP